MNFYYITFKDGTTAEEYGDSVGDVMAFCALCLRDRGPVDTIELAL